MDTNFAPAMVAIYAGDLETLRALLDAEPDLARSTSAVGHPTLLQLVACEEGKLPDPVGAARVLLGAGAPTHYPLVSAAGCNARQVLKFLLDSGVGVDGEELWTPLDEALYWSNPVTASLLVDRGARVRALSTAAGLGDVTAMREFFDGSERLTPSAGPIASPFPDTVPAELASDPGAIVDHAFVMAINSGRRPAAELLLSRGARVNAKPPGYHWHGTALHAAIWRGDRELTEWLLSCGADPTIRDGLANSDAAGWAKHHGHQDLATLLAGRG